jgi:hypothetical protein
MYHSGMKVCLALLLLGCDPQVGADYRGEPMARFEGTVEAVHGSPPLPVDAALLWQPRGTVTIDTPIVVEKSFPAHFKMAILVPPPLDVEQGGHAEALLSAIARDAPPEAIAMGQGVWGEMDDPRVHFFEHDTTGLLAREFGNLPRGYHLISHTPLPAPTQAQLDACVAELAQYGDQSQLCSQRLLAFREVEVPMTTPLVLEVNGP